MLLSLLGLVGYLETAIGAELATGIEQRVLTLASRALTPDTVSSLVQPLLTEVLRQGRVDLASIGFVLALWAGSTAMAAYVNTIAIAYGQRDERGAVHSRLLALGMYLAGVVVGVVLLPLLVVGPDTLLRLIPTAGYDVAEAVIQLGYWPTILILSGLTLVTLYHFAVPLRSRWRDHVLGAIVATGIWLVGSVAVRSYLQFAFGTISVYGPVATPIAALLFFYLAALAVLIGAEVNGHRNGR